MTPIWRHFLDPQEEEIVDHSSAVGGRVFLLPLKDLLYGGTETAMAFDGVLPAESLSLAGQAVLSWPLACQSTPEPVPGPISLSGTAGPAACGETGMVGWISGRHSVRANRPDRATKSQGNLFFSGGNNGGHETV